LGDRSGGRPNGSGGATPFQQFRQAAAAAEHNGLELRPMMLAQAGLFSSRRTNCVDVAVRSATRGAAVGATFGAVFAAINSPATSGSAPAIASHVVQAALRNAGAFAAWTGVYGLTRCELTKARRRDDILNPAIAGGATGAVLSFATIPRAHWRFSTQQVMHNAGISAVIAVAFDILNRI
jgi:Tim17/Tim22/Tim23/Pmp24 family